VKRGEVYEYVVGSQRARIVIVSATRYGATRATFVVVRGSTDQPLPSTVAVAVDHPVTGVVDLVRLRPVDPTAVQTRLGALTATALRSVDAGLRTYLDL